MRPVGGVAQPAALILLISLEIAFEPFDMAVACEQAPTIDQESDRTGEEF